MTLTAPHHQPFSRFSTQHSKFYRCHFSVLVVLTQVFSILLWKCFNDCFWN